MAGSASGPVEIRVEDPGGGVQRDEAGAARERQPSNAPPPFSGTDSARSTRSGPLCPLRFTEESDILSDKQRQVLDQAG